MLQELNEKHSVDVVPTFMGAHALPPEYAEGQNGGKEGFINLMMQKLLPYIAEHNLADFVDIFVEDEVFSPEEGRPYLEKAKELGFDIKVHADEIKAIGGTQLAGELGAKSAEQMCIRDSSIPK